PVLAHAALRKCLPDRRLGLPIDPWATQRDTLRLRPRQPGMDALDDHVSLELREGPCDGEQELALGSSGVDGLLVDGQVDLARVEMPDGVQEVRQRAPNAV